MGWKSKALVTVAAVAGGLLSLRVHAFGLVEPTVVGVVWAYVFGALVCGLGAWVLLAVVGRVAGALSRAWRHAGEMADPRRQDPAGWVEPLTSADLNVAGLDVAGVVRHVRRGGVSS